MEEFKDNKKFQDIVNKAKILFWKYGIKRVSIEEICAETPVSKMTFYKFFNNKIHLAETILTDLLKKSYCEYRSIMAKPIPFPEKIKQSILLKHNSTLNISEEFINDIYSNDNTSLINIINEYTEKMYADLKLDFCKAQEEGWIRKDIRSSFMIYMINDISKKMMDNELNSMYSDKHDLIMELTNYFFYGIMNVENKKADER